MPNHHPISFDRLYGGMTTDYFAFFCPECHHEIINGLYIDEKKSSPTIYYATVRCKECNKNYEFKLQQGLGELPKK